MLYSEYSLDGCPSLPQEINFYISILHVVIQGDIKWLQSIQTAYRHQRKQFQVIFSFTTDLLTCCFWSPYLLLPAGCYSIWNVHIVLSCCDIHPCYQVVSKRAAHQFSMDNLLHCDLYRYHGFWRSSALLAGRPQGCCSSHAPSKS